MSMNPKMLSFIEGLSKAELQGLRDDLLNGNIQSEIDGKLSQLEERQTICPVCNNDPGPAGFTLLFGPADFRKKATFCGYDCLEYFIKVLKDISQESHKQEAQKQEADEHERTMTAKAGKKK